MTISTTDSTEKYTGNGATTAFPVGFVFFDADELEVIERTIATGAEVTKALSTDYTVSGGAGDVGTVTANTAPASTVEWHIRRKTDPTQEVDYAENDSFPAETHERALDRVVAQLQEFRTDLARALLIPKSDDVATAWDVLANSVSRASMYLAFGADGKPTLAAGTTSDIVATPFAETLLDDNTAADMRATLGLGSAALAGAASESAAGIAEFASLAERNAATSSALAVHAQGLAETIFNRGYIFGLTLSNNAGDATNDIDIAAGIAAADASPYRLMELAAGITKRLDANWAVGTNQGGLDTGAIANTPYHVWLIRRSDTGVVDVLFSTSATAPTMPANYDQKRRIGSILRVSGAIVGFSQVGDEFLRKASILDIAAANPGTSAVTRTLSVPVGIVVWAIMHVLPVNTGSGVTAFCVITDLARNDEAPSASVAPLATAGNLASAAGNASSQGSRMTVRTNASAQVRSRFNQSDASVTLYIATIGWIDRRGRDA